MIYIYDISYDTSTASNDTYDICTYAYTYVYTYIHIHITCTYIYILCIYIYAEVMSTWRPLDFIHAWAFYVDGYRFSTRLSLLGGELDQPGLTIPGFGYKMVC
jgi:hypothetical protein